MNWKQEAANDLINYSRKKESLSNIRKQVSILNSQFASIKGAVTNETPVQGGVSRYEDLLINNITKRRRLYENYPVTKRQINLIEKGLSRLDSRKSCSRPILHK